VLASYWLKPIGEPFGQVYSPIYPLFKDKKFSKKNTFFKDKNKARINGLNF